MNSHYKQHTIEAIDVIHDWDLGFELGNVIKYIARHKHKGSELRDLEKATWYLQTYIKRQYEALQKAADVLTTQEKTTWDNAFKNKAEQMYENTITGTTHLG